MNWTPDKIAHELRERGEEWANADAAFRALDDTTKTVLSQISLSYADEKSVAKAEMKARADERYTNHLDALAKARRSANLAKVRFDTFKVWIELKRSEMATQRAEMQMR